MAYFVNADKNPIPDGRGAETVRILFCGICYFWKYLENLGNSFK